MTREAPGVGFICKTCGEPSPLGIGYASTAPGAREASLKAAPHEHTMAEAGAARARQRE